MRNNPSSIKGEIMVMCSIEEMKKLFDKDSLIVWYDPKVTSSENTEYEQALKTISSNMMTFDNHEIAAGYLKSIIEPCQVISSGANGELLTKEILDVEKVVCIHIFCGNIAIHKPWSKKYNKIVSVDASFLKLMENVAFWYRKISFARISLPLFGEIFSENDESGYKPMHWYLKGLLDFQNREQAKRDFLALAEAVYGENKQINTFEKNYTNYNMEDILNWYTKECFFYKMTCDPLRKGLPDLVLYSRFALKDLETAIKQKYKEESKEFSGMLYRGTCISDQEWNLFQNNVRKEIEMFGFLLTTKKKELAVASCKTDGVDNNGFITIIVPDTSKIGEDLQGFAELKEYSQFREDEEVLFNIRTRFTVLAAVMENIEGKNCRHVVLLYGAEAMRRYMNMNPSIQVEISNKTVMKCTNCGQEMGLPTSFGELYFNVCSDREYICKNCIRLGSAKKTPWLCVYSPSQTFNKTLEGFVAMVNYPQGFNPPFYGYSNCSKCQSQKFEQCHRCLTCQEEQKVFCRDCEGPCINAGHTIILESYPFSFWSTRLSDKEIYFSKLENDSEPSLFPQADAFLKAGNEDKAIDYYKKCLENYGNEPNEMIARIYNELGKIYENRAEYKVAIDFYTKALKVKIENKVLIATFYDNLGMVYRKTDNFEAAIKSHSEALGLRIKLFPGKKDLEVAKSYIHLGTAYSRWEKYKKAIENYEKARDIQKEILGEKHKETATTYHLIGHAYLGLENNEDAIENYSKVFEIRKAVLGENHESTLEVKKDLEYTRLLLPNQNQALPNLGNRTLEDEIAIADALLEAGENEKAIELYKKCEKIIESDKKNEDQHKESQAKVFRGLGKAYDGLADYQKSQYYYKIGLEIKIEDNEMLIASLNEGLAIVETHLGQIDEALIHHTAAFRIKKRHLGEKDLETAKSYVYIGDLYFRSERYLEAIKQYNNAIEIQKVNLGEGHQDTATTYHMLGNAFLGQKKYPSAIEAFSKAYEIRRELFGDGHEKTIESKNALEKTKRLKSK